MKTHCWFIGPLRVRWAGPDFKPLYSEAHGRRRWYGVGRLKARIDWPGSPYARDTTPRRRHGLR